MISSASTIKTISCILQYCKQQPGDESSAQPAVNEYYGSTKQDYFGKKQKTGQILGAKLTNNLLVEMCGGNMLSRMPEQFPKLKKLLSRNQVSLHVSNVEDPTLCMSLSSSTCNLFQLGMGQLLLG